MFEPAYAATGDHRYVDGVRDRARELEVVAVARAVAIHAGDMNSPSPSPRAAYRPRERIDAGRRAPAVNVDLPAWWPALFPAARHLARVDCDDDALGAEPLGAVRTRSDCMHGGGIEGHFVGAGASTRRTSSTLRKPAADRERDEHLLGAAGRQLDDDVAAARATR